MSQFLLLFLTIFIVFSLFKPQWNIVIALLLKLFWLSQRWSHEVGIYKKEENKKLRKHENKNSTKKVIKKEENKNSTKEVTKKKGKNFLFFLITFLVEFFFLFFLLSYFLVFFYEFPSQNSTVASKFPSLYLIFGAFSFKMLRFFQAISMK